MNYTPNWLARQGLRRKLRHNRTGPRNQDGVDIELASCVIIFIFNGWTMYFT